MPGGNMPRLRINSGQAVAFLLLSLILIGGAVPRLLGHNWDDFSYVHPDERFLTILLLPQVGGNNEFTRDDQNYPALQVFTRRDASGLRSGDDILRLPPGQVGAIGGSPAGEAARRLMGADHARAYADYWEAEIALLTGEVSALLVDERQQPIDDAAVHRLDSFNSESLQALECKRRHPGSDGRGGYFDTRCSPLNPHNAGHSFYVYGTFPLFLAHFASDILRQATDAGLPLVDFQSGHLVWRGISTLFDLLTILLVFALGRRIHGSWVGLLAALLYAAAPLAIQKAHFGTVNAATTFFVTLALYYAVGAQQRGKLGSFLLFGLACGTAVASRINVAPLALVIILAAVYRAAPAFDARLRPNERRQIIIYQLLGLILAGAGAFLAFRVFNPYAFAGPGFLDILPNERWLENLQRIGAGVSSLQDFPPNWHWVARSPIVHIFKDMLFWGMGLGFGILGWFGWCWAAYRLLRGRKRASDLLILILWVGGYLLWMSRLTALTIRYFLPLYGALAVLAGWCLVELIQHARASGRSLPIVAIPLVTTGALLSAVGGYQFAVARADATAVTALALGLVLLVVAFVPRFSAARPLVLAVFAVVFSAAWGLMFANIYRHQNTLVQGSRYLFERVPGDFAMRIDGADDSVPLINIAVDSTGAGGDRLTGPPFDRATLYREGAPVSVDFRAPRGGSVRSVFAPHLGDPQDDPQPEELVIRIYEQGGATALSQAVLRTDLSREIHPLGASYSMPLDPPLQVEEGREYSFVVEVAPGSGAVIGSGSVALNEGAWDNAVTGINTCRLPDGLSLADDPPPGLLSASDCQGSQAFYSLVNSVDQIMSFPVDNQLKYDDLLRSLDLADYLTIASNRFYDTEPRNQMRWPLTTLYYQKLFAGELGYELEAVFEESFEFGPWRVADQRLPIHNSPYWLNELEADEAFHVYDHPTVFIFRKTDEYSRAKLEAILSQASLRQAHELRNDAGAAQLLGVFYWVIRDAEPVPTGLMFTPAEREIQTNGGTWSDRFFSDSIINSNQVIGAVVWYGTIFLFGALAFPLVFAIFPKMADGGYGVSKLVGMLLVAWFAWAVSSLKIPIWSQGGILLSLILLAIASALLVRIRLIEFLRDHWRRLAWMELIGLIAFLALIAVRLTNPDLWHPAKGGEKPMDFAYLNGVLRSTTFPPIDPWFSGGFINYYYFGFVLVGAPTLLLGVVPAFAYNLMIPTIFSLTGMGAFSTAFNMLSRWRRPIGDDRRLKPSRGRPGSPWVAGIMALLLCVLFGNLDTTRVIGNAVAAHGGYQRPESLERFLIDEYAAANDRPASPDISADLSRRAAELHPWDSLRYEINNSLSLIGGLVRGAARLLQGEQLHINSDRWYWGPSRVLAETPGSARQRHHRDALFHLSLWRSPCAHDQHAADSPDAAAPFQRSRGGEAALSPVA